MEQYNSQEEVRRNIISDMVKKRNTIVPVIGEDTIAFPLTLLWLSYGTLKRIRCAFIEGLKVMRRYTLLADTSASIHQVGLFAPRTYVWETVSIGFISLSINLTSSPPREIKCWTISI